MIKIVLIAALVGMAAAAPQEAQAQIIDREDVRSPGGYHYSYETGNGISAQETGRIKNPDAPPEDQIQEVRGSYSYTAPDGTVIRLSYTADENGYRPTGAHIP